MPPANTVIGYWTRAATAARSPAATALRSSATKRSTSVRSSPPCIASVAAIARGNILYANHMLPVSISRPRVRLSGERRRDSMSQFMLLLYQDPTGFAKLSPEEMQKAIEKYMAWTKKPFTVDSKRLGGDAGKVVRPGGGKARTTDGPFSETKEVLGGFYLIDARDYDEAVARASEHPHIEYGGTIEVRKLWEPPTA